MHLENNNCLPSIVVVEDNVLKYGTLATAAIALVASIVAVSMACYLYRKTDSLLHKNDKVTKTKITPIKTGGYENDNFNF